MTTAAIRCFAVTDPQVQNPQPEEFCLQQPHNTRFQIAQTQDRNECNPVRPVRDLTFDKNAASYNPTILRSREQSHRTGMNAKSLCLRGV